MWRSTCSTSSRDTFHRFNRVVLLSVMALSFVLPLCVITIHKELPAEAAETLAPLPASAMMHITSTEIVLPASEFHALFPTETIRHAAETMPAAVKSELVEWRYIIDILFVAGIACALIFTAVAIAKVVCVIRSGRRERLDKRTILVRKSGPVTPFSWLRYIVMSYTDYDENGAEIIAHEKAHIRNRHSYDLLLANLCACMQWFNPAMWLLRQELRNIHEYEADRAVLASGADAKKYQLFLIKKAVGTGRYSIANSLNHSNLKNRITMMLQKKSPLGARAKALVLLPLLFVGLSAFATTVWVAPEPENKGTTKNADFLEILFPSSDISNSGLQYVYARIPADTVRFNTSKMLTPDRDTVYLTSGYYVIVPEESDGSKKRIVVEDIDGKPFEADGRRARRVFAQTVSVKYNADSKEHGFFGEEYEREPQTFQSWSAEQYASGSWREKNAGTEEAAKQIAALNDDEDDYIFRGYINIVVYKGGEITVEDEAVAKEGFIDAINAAVKRKGGSVQDYTYLFNYGKDSPVKFMEELRQQIKSTMGDVGFASCGGVGSLDFRKAMGGRTTAKAGRPLRIPMDTVHFQSSKILTPQKDTVELISGYYIVVPNECDVELDRVVVENIDGKPFRSDGRARWIYAEEGHVNRHYKDDMIEMERIKLGETVVVQPYGAQSYPAGLWAGRNPQATSMGFGSFTVAHRKKPGMWHSFNLDKISIVIYEGGEITVEDMAVSKENFTDLLTSIVKAKGKPFDQFKYSFSYGGKNSQKLLNELTRQIGAALGNVSVESSGGGAPLYFENAMGLR